MPKVGPVRQLIALRLLPTVIDALDERAEEEGLRSPDGKPNRSAVIRLMIAYGLRHMPKKWRP